MTPYERWLIKRRVYCEHPDCLMHKATHVVKQSGHDLVMCDRHSGTGPQPDWRYKPTERTTKQ